MKGYDIEKQELMQYAIRNAPEFVGRLINEDIDSYQE